MDLAKQTTKIYLRESMRYKWQFIALWAILPIPVISGSIIMPIFYAAIIDKLSEFAGGAAVSQNEVILLFLGMAFFELIHFLGWRISDWIMILYQPKVLRNLDRNVFSRFLELSYTFHVNSFGGSLVARGRRFVNTYERLFDSFYFEVVPMIIRLLFILIVLFTQVPTIAFILLFWIVAFVWIQSYMVIKKMPLSRAAAEADSATTANLADTVTNISSVKSFGRRKFEDRNFAETTLTQYKKRLTSWKRDWSIRTFQAVAMTIASLLIMYISIELMFRGAITIGVIVLIGFYVRRAFDDLWGFGRTMQRIEHGFSDAAEMTKTFQEEVEIKDPVKPIKSKIHAGKIDFMDVKFQYNDAASDEVLFKDFNLTIKPGTKVGLVGPSGGGKTTITRLLLRLYDPNAGEIRIDNQDIKDFTQEDLRSNIAYVPQEPVLFHRSLADNIRYGNPSANNKDIVKAGKDAHADVFIDRLPKKYNTLVGERGTKLSGGEKQRVAVARAMLKNSPLLVLDEATSALDSDSERLIQDALKTLMRDKTTIVIAHRLSTIQKMDRIIVLAEGEIVEDGTHNELVKNKGLYSELWSHQSGGFIED